MYLSISVSSCNAVHVNFAYFARYIVMRLLCTMKYCFQIKTKTIEDQEKQLSDIRQKLANQRDILRYTVAAVNCD